MKPAWITLTLLCLGAVAPQAAAARELLLVAGVSAPAVELNALDVRKLFLGMPVVRNGMLLRPVCNDSDPQIRDAFFQYVVSMSESAYDLRMLSQMNIEGRIRPPQLHSASEVLSRLKADRAAVSYVWDSDLTNGSPVRVLRVLWKE